MRKIILNLKKKYHKLKKNKQILSSYINKEVDEENININYSELYIKTNKLINNFNKYIKYNFDEFKIIIKGDKEKALILHNLTKIETLINCFLSKVNDFKIKYPNKLKLYKMLIDKNKKMRKIMEQKRLKELKLKMENKRINKKNDHLIIIPPYKINNFNLIAKNLIMKRNKVKKEKKTETVYDYLSE
jgi:hypothetical protein